MELEPCNDEKQRHVYAVNGNITSYLRKMWGVKKIRADGDKHHALDATIIAVTTQGAINKITKYNQGKERFFSSIDNYVDEDGVIVNTSDCPFPFKDKKTCQ
jgi:CRISPR-associated endonuclease Csn1